MKFAPMDKVKLKTASHFNKLRTLKKRVPELDDPLLGEYWEFEEDGLKQFDWEENYEFVARPKHFNWD
ncbi:hypothetical protein ABRD05_16435 [Bacillus velezensis]